MFPDDQIGEPDEEFAHIQREIVVRYDALKDLPLRDIIVMVHACAYALASRERGYLPAHLAISLASKSLPVSIGDTDDCLAQLEAGA